MFEESFYVAVYGGQDFTDYQLLKEKCTYYLQQKLLRGVNVVIVSAHLQGASVLSEDYAKELNLPCIQIPTEWKLYGKRAAQVRDLHIADRANAMIAFWDGQSNDVKYAIDTFKKRGIPVRVINYAPIDKVNS